MARVCSDGSATVGMTAWEGGAGRGHEHGGTRAWRGQAMAARTWWRAGSGRRGMVVRKLQGGAMQRGGLAWEQQSWREGGGFMADAG